MGGGGWGVLYPLGLDSRQGEKGRRLNRAATQRPFLMEIESRVRFISNLKTACDGGSVVMFKEF